VMSIHRWLRMDIARISTTRDPEMGMHQNTAETMGRLYIFLLNRKSCVVKGDYTPDNGTKTECQLGSTERRRLGNFIFSA
jgi:hypothetical protein